MATRDTEGRREIEAARQRLSIAKSQTTFLSKTLLSAKAAEVAARKTREDIQTQLEVSNKDLVDAQKFLAEAEVRWEVIAIDDDDDISSVAIDGNNKKRKANAVSPQGNNSNNNNNAGDAQGLPPMRRSSAAQQTPRNPNWSNRLLHQAMGVPTSDSPSNSRAGVSNIVVEGCQATYANGTYTRGCDIDGCASFIKKDDNGGDVVIYRHINKCWYIALSLNNGEPHVNGNGLVYYKTYSTASRLNSLPPAATNDWVSVYGGLSVATLRFHYSNDAAQGQSNNMQSAATTTSVGGTSVHLTGANTNNNDSDIIVQGFGTEEVNGTYKKDTTKRSAFFVKKNVHWDGKVGNFRIWCNNSKFWYVSGSMEFGGKVLYKNISSTNSASVPPQTGWIPVMGYHRPLCPSPTMKQRG